MKIMKNAKEHHLLKAMGHDLKTHLKSYSRFNTKDLENAFDYYAKSVVIKH